MVEQKLQTMFRIYRFRNYIALDVMTSEVDNYYWTPEFAEAYAKAILEYVEDCKT